MIGYLLTALDQALDDLESSDFPGTKYTPHEIHNYLAPIFVEKFKDHSTPYLHGKDAGMGDERAHIIAYLSAQAELEGTHSPALKRAIRGIQRGDHRDGA